MSVGQRWPSEKGGDGQAGEKERGCRVDKDSKGTSEVCACIRAQQAILLEASELGYRLVDARICRLLEMSITVLFEDSWVERCKKPVRIEPCGVRGCVATAKNPADCFGIKHEDEWFDDPFAGRRTVPP